MRFGDVEILNTTQSDFATTYDITALTPGSYTLTVRAVASETDLAGDYSFRLLDLSSAPLLTTGTPVSSVLNPANQSDAYRFEAKAGDRFFFDRREQSGGDTYWRLLDPFGRPLWGPTSFGSDVDVTTLPYDGTYTLLIEGRYYVGGTASYGFNVSPAPLTEPIVLSLEAVPGPDLVVQALQVTPLGSEIRAGGTVLVSWSVTNNGDEPASGAWTDEVLVKQLDANGNPGQQVLKLLVDMMLLIEEKYRD